MSRIISAAIILMIFGWCMSLASAQSYITDGNQTYGSDGSLYQTYGNTTYGYSGDGHTSVCSTYGNVTICN